MEIFILPIRKPAFNYLQQQEQMRNSLVFYPKKHAE